MQSHAVVARPEKIQNGVAGPPDLGRPVTSLAENVQKAMGALYNVHSALMSIRRSKRTNGLLEQLVQSRNAFRGECETFTMFLQISHGYVEDFISLCQFLLLGRPMKDCLSLAEDILHSARDVLKEVKDIQRAHITKIEQMSPLKTRLLSIFSKSNSSGTDRPRPTHTPTVAVRLDVNKVVTSSFDALEQISVDLNDLVIFWGDQVANLTAVSAKRQPLPTSVSNVRQLVQTWKQYQTIILNAVSSISESSDAMMVDPADPSKSSNGNSRIQSRIALPAAPTQTKATRGKQNRASPFWVRFQGLFCGALRGN